MTGENSRWRFGAPVIAFLLASALLDSPSRSSPYSTINSAAEAGPINVDRLRGNISMLSGSGGNITALSSVDGFLLIDTGIGLSKKMIVQALETINPVPIKLAINTHWHWDHADGNDWVRASGATIMADRKTIQRLGQTILIPEWEHTFTPIRSTALPNVPITKERKLSFGGQTIVIRPYQAGHTDNDISVYFIDADVLSVGDTFWNGQYPFIDHPTGGSINGAIRAANANIAMAGERTIIVPGHGPVGDRRSQIAFRDMLVTVRDRVSVLKKRGMTLEQVQGSKPTSDLDQKWGQSIISGQLFTALVYHDL
ncbi:MAG: MBL fold metallo-hydrolase [Burkholderiales bacterium]|nr:MBL fold metallo-hydrolase [Phycisphaerae bacterium]